MAPERRRGSGARSESLVGQRFTVTLDKLVHGGHCVARHDGRVLFVRHGLPGERVVAEVTEGEDGARFLRADAVEVLDASPERVAPRCPVAGPGGCGGCDFQHVTVEAQRQLLAGVVREQLQRIAGIDRDVRVEPVPGDREGLDWRTRVRFSVDGHGRLGLRKHRSHDVVPLQDCPIAHPGLPRVLAERWPGYASVEAVVSGAGQGMVVVEPAPARGRSGRSSRPARVPRVEADGVVTPDGRRLRGRTHVDEPAAGRHWRVSGSGFWQVHPGAAETLVSAAMQMLAPRPGERVLDLYCGVGLFAGALADRVGEHGEVVAVEGDAGAVRDARRNLHDRPQVRVVRAGVAAALRRLSPGRVDAVLLDPPRTGARRDVVDQVASLLPRAVCQVACDPAALARDISLFAEQGYAVHQLRAFDLFPMTHHVECVALLVPRNDAQGSQGSQQSQGSQGSQGSQE